MSRSPSPLVLTALVLALAGCGSPAKTSPEVDICRETDAPGLEATDVAVADCAGCADVDGADATFQNVVYRLTLPDDGYEKLTRDIWADVSVEGTLVARGVTYRVEVELQGSSGRTFPKKSFAIDFEGPGGFRGDPFDDGGDPDGFKHLALKAMYKDQSLVREAISFEVLRAMGERAPRVGFANLCLNGDDWGLYAVVEPVDKPFLRRQGLDDGGGLYKAIDQKADFSPSRTMEEAFEKRTREDEPWSELEELLSLLQTTPIDEAEFRAAIDPVFPLERYMARMIWVSYTQNTDGWRQNFYLYNEPGHAGPFWHQLPWDSDMSFSNHWNLDVPVHPVEADPLVDGGTYFSRRLVRIEALRRAYVARFEQLLDTLLAPEAVTPIAEAIFLRVRADLSRDLERWERSSTVDTEFDEIRTFITERPGILRELLVRFADDPAAK